MDLRTYLFLERLSVKKFATEIGYAPEYISSIRNGTKNPGRKLRNCIIKTTNGKITENDFPPLPKYKKRKTKNEEENENQAVE